MNIQTFPGGGMGPVNVVRYALSGLRHQRAATALNLAAVALSAVYLFVLGFYGTRVYRYQRDLLAERLPTRVVATTPEVTDRGKRFTDERLAALARLPGVALAFPHVELNVRLSLGSGPAVDLPAEGTLAGDPALAPGRLAWGGGVTQGDGRQAVLSRPLFEKLGGVVGAGPSPGAVTVQVARSVGGREERQALRLQVVGLLPHLSAERVYVPVQLATWLDLWCTHKVEAVPGVGGRPAASPVTYPLCHAYALPRHSERVLAEARDLGVQVRAAGEVEAIDPAGPVRAFPERLDSEPLGEADRMAFDTILGRPLPPPARVSDGAACAAGVSLTLLAGAEASPVGFADALAYQVAEREARAHGLCLRLLRPLETRRLLRFEVRDARRPDGRVTDELVTVLGMSRPTFEAARPSLSVQGRVGAGRVLELAGSDAGDPERFAARLLAGGWLRPADGPEAVVLPRALAAELAAGEPLRSLPGQRVTVAFRRERAGGEEEMAHLSLRVVGVCDAPRAYVPLPLARDLSSWQAGRLVFNEARRAFEAPAERALKAGHVRCTVFARDAESVREVVGALRRQGYHTEDSLADQDGLRRLAHVLAFLVGFFALGCVLNAAITVLVTTMMSVQSKVWEIGILRAQGLGSRDVLSLFAAQGALIGGGAFLLAAAAVALLEPWLRAVVSQALAFKASVLSGSPFEASLWWLPALVLGVSLGFSLLGVLVPAALACRLSPVEALRKRE